MRTQKIRGGRESQAESEAGWFSFETGWDLVMEVLSESLALFSLLAGALIIAWMLFSVVRSVMPEWFG